MQNYLLNLTKYGKTLTLRFSSDWKLDTMNAFVEGMIPRDYKYDKYLSKNDDDDNDDSPYNLHVQCTPKNVKSLSELCEEVKILRLEYI